MGETDVSLRTASRETGYRASGEAGAEQTAAHVGNWVDWVADLFSPGALRAPLRRRLERQGRAQSRYLFLALSRGGAETFQPVSQTGTMTRCYEQIGFSPLRLARRAGKAAPLSRTTSSAKSGANEIDRYLAKGRGCRVACHWRT